MRLFGKDAPDLFCFQIKGDKRTYKIPLAASMPYSILKWMQDHEGAPDEFDVQVEMLRKYMGPAVDELDATTLSDILKAWCEESSKQGASMGES